MAAKKAPKGCYTDEVRVMEKKKVTSGGERKHLQTPEN